MIPVLGLARVAPAERTVLLSVPAVLSCVVTVLAFFVGVAAITVSSGPGWRELRWFGVAALWAAVYGMCALESTLDVAPGVRAFFGRLGAASVSLIIASWYVYFAAARDRPVARWEQSVVVGLVGIAILWMVPGLFRTSEVFVRNVPWLGVSYTTTRPTVLGQITYAVLLGLTAVLDARLFLSWRRGTPGAFADFLGVSVQLVAGVNDALAASGQTSMPYALDVGQFVVVLAVGTTLMARFVEGARALERSSAELRAAQTELVRRERLAALGELSAVVAHEVRNPLTVIFNALASLRKQPLSGDAGTLLGIVGEEAERLKRVVSELLEFARPRDPSMDLVAPIPLVEGAVEAATLGVDGNDVVEIEIETGEAGSLPEVSGDEHLLRQALINLVTNALQAAGRKSRVRVRTTTEGQPPAWLSFNVHDDGDGIPATVAERMFTPFFTTRASGTGLGLAIVKRIAEAHGGDISWKRTAPRGVTFTLRVPIRPPSTLRQVAGARLGNG